MSCQGTTTKKKPCKNLAMIGHKVCRSHLRQAHRFQVTEENAIRGVTIPTIAELQTHPNVAQAMGVCQANQEQLIAMQTAAHAAQLPQNNYVYLELTGLQARYNDLRSELEQLRSTRDNWGSVEAELRETIKHQQKVYEQFREASEVIEALRSKLIEFQEATVEKDRQYEDTIATIQQERIAGQRAMQATGMELRATQKEVEETQQALRQTTLSLEQVAAARKQREEEVKLATEQIHMLRSERKTVEEQRRTEETRQRMQQEQYQQDVEALRKNHDQELGKLRQQMLELERNNQNLSGSSQSVVQQLEALNLRFQEAERVKTELVHTNTELNSAKAQVDLDFDQLSEELKQAKRNYKVSEDERIIHKKRVEELVSQLASSQIQYDELQGRFEALNIKYDEDLSQIRNETQSLRDALDQVRATAKDLDQRYEATQAELEETQRKLNKVEASTAALTEEIDGLQTYKDLWINNAPSTIANMLQTVRNRIDACETAANDIDEFTGDWNAEQVERIKEQVSSTCSKMSDMRQRLKQLEDHTAKQEAEIRNLQDVRNVASHQLTEANYAKEALEERVQRLMEEIKNLSTSNIDVATLGKILSLLDKDTDDCSRLLNDLTETIVKNPTLKVLEDQLRNITSKFCKRVLRPIAQSQERLSNIRRNQVAVKPVEVKTSVKRVEARPLTDEERAQLEAAAKRSTGMVRVAVRVRCSEKQSSGFTAGTDEKSSIIRVNYKGSMKKLVRKRLNLAIQNDDHLVTGTEKCNGDKPALLRRNTAFYDLAMGSILKNTYMDISLIAFGQSGSGKTTTVNDVLERLYGRIGSRMSQAKVTFIDVYNGKSRDLLQFTTNRSLKKSFLELVARRKGRTAFLKKYILPARSASESQIKMSYEQIKNQYVPKEDQPLFTKLYIEPKPMTSEQDDEKAVRDSQKLKDNIPLTYVPVGSYAEYEQTYKTALMLRPVTLTPQNTDGSSRSHLIIQFKIPLTDQPGQGWDQVSTQYTKLSIVDLAGSEDYSEVNALLWSKQMAKVGIYVPSTQRGAQSEQVREESNNINSSLQELGQYLGYINSKQTGITPVEPRIKEELVKVMLRLGVIGHKGLTTLVTTFKSGSNESSEDPDMVLREADRTLGKLIEFQLVPSDTVLDKLRQ